MIYWMRTREIALPAMYLLMSIMWSFGGWMIVSHAFSVRSRERLVSGGAAGFVLRRTRARRLQLASAAAVGKRPGESPPAQ